ncbi:hypothetical protein BKI52_16470 [marine bacterium AO1-C]|nr:hypothetical protein BKI52_16470 [marine bacterium AO1-C]
MKKILLLAAVFTLYACPMTFAQNPVEPGNAPGNSGSSTVQKTPQKPKKKIVLGVPTLADMPTEYMETYAARSTGKMGDKYRIDRDLVGLVTFKKLPKTDFMFGDLRFNLFSSDLEIKLNGVRRYIRSAKVKEFVIVDGFKRIRFINTDFYEGKMKDKKGFFEIIEDGDVQLLKKVRIIQQAGSYNIAKSVGNKDGRIFQKNKFYLAKGEKIYPVKGKKQIIKLFDSFGLETEKVIKENKLKVKRMSNLATLVKIYNGQAKK